MQNELNNLRLKIPLVEQWISNLLKEEKGRSQAVAYFQFKNLAQFFPADFLNPLQVVITERIPVPPLEQLGLKNLYDLTQHNFIGIAYEQTYFVRADYEFDEIVHFHEIIHLVQWKELDAENFLLLYALGLMEKGYRESPLEVMAYAYDGLFREGKCPKDVFERVKQESKELCVKTFKNKRG